MSAIRRYKSWDDEVPHGQSHVTQFIIFGVLFGMSEARQLNFGVQIDVDTLIHPRLIDYFRSRCIQSHVTI